MMDNKYKLNFRADQVELAMDCFEHVKKMLNEGTVLSEAHRMAGRFVQRRLSELQESVQKQFEIQVEREKRD